MWAARRLKSAWASAGLARGSQPLLPRGQAGRIGQSSQQRLCLWHGGNCRHPGYRDGVGGRRHLAGARFEPGPAARRRGGGLRTPGYCGSRGRATRRRAAPGHQTLQLLCRSGRNGQDRGLRTLDLDPGALRAKLDGLRGFPRDPGILFAGAVAGRRLDRPLGHLLGGSHALLPADGPSSVHGRQPRATAGDRARTASRFAGQMAARAGAGAVPHGAALPRKRPREPVPELRRTARRPAPARDRCAHGRSGWLAFSGRVR